jgi:hypothetical protein
MSQSHKKIAWVLASFIVAGLLLTGAVVALAAETTTLVGTLVFEDPLYSVDSQTFTVTQTTVCTDLDGNPVIPCSGLVDKTVEATVEVAETGPYTATEITALGTFEGVLTAMTSADPSVWTVGGESFTVSAAVGAGFAVRDVVFITYKNVSGTFVAVKVEKVEVSTSVGKVIAMGDTWQINGDSYTVNSDTMVYADAALGDIVQVTYYGENIAVDISLYPTTTAQGRLTSLDPVAVEGLDGLTTNEWTDMYDGAVVGDIVTVVYYEYPEDVLIASEISLYAPMKNENNRCEDWQATDFKIPAGILKQLPEDVDMAQVYAMFCQGFGWGEIKNAFKLTSENPEDLLARKAKGEGWGQIKKDFESTPTHENNGKGHSNDETSPTGKPETAGKPEKQDNLNKPVSPGNSDHSNNGNNDNNSNNGKANGKNK